MALLDARKDGQKGLNQPYKVSAETTASQLRPALKPTQTDTKTHEMLQKPSLAHGQQKPYDLKL